MRRSAVIAALGALLLTVPAFAHTHLAKSDPADGSVLTKAPEHVSLEFAQPVKFTEFSIQKGDEKPEKLLVPLPEAPATKISATTPKLSAAGVYVVSWRAVGGDGHVMSGKVRFTIAAGNAGDSAASH